MAWTKALIKDGKPARRRDPFDNPDIPCPLTNGERHRLAVYNGHVNDGLVHRDDYAERMQELQRTVDAWSEECMEAAGQRDTL